jgi:hypothetical protein
MLRRLGVLTGALIASLALASSAQAAPTTPIMAPIPAYVCGNPTATWTKSTPDPGATIIGYRVDLGDLTTGTSTALFTNTLSKTLSPLVNGHTYVARVRAMQFSPGAGITYSWSSGRVFKKLCLVLDPGRIANEYAEWDPNPPCIMCGFDWGQLRIDDPVIQRAFVQTVSVREGLERLQIEADGSVRFG